jgi:hypothetical protein
MHSAKREDRRAKVLEKNTLIRSETPKPEVHGAHNSTEFVQFLSEGSCHSPRHMHLLVTPTICEALRKLYLPRRLPRFYIIQGQGVGCGVTGESSENSFQ